MPDPAETHAPHPTESIPPESAVVPAAGAPELRSLLSLAVAAIVIVTLVMAQDVVVPVVLAVLASFVLSPLVGRLEAVRVPRAVAVLVAIALTFGVIGGIGVLIGRQATALVADAPRYVASVEEKVRGLEGVITSRLGALTGRIGRERLAPASGTDSAGSASSDAALPRSSNAAPVIAGRPEGAAPPSASVFAAVRSLVSPVLGPLETTLIVLVIAVFILMEREDLRDRLIRLAGARDLRRTTLALDDAAQRLSRYFVAQLAVNTSFGVIIGVGLWAVGVPSPAVWGLFAGLLRFVPYIGPILAALAPLLLAAATVPGWGRVIEVAALFAIVEPFTGYVVEPLLYGHSTGLAPISVIVAAVFWTWMWGPIGLILSTPLTLCLVVLGRHVKSLEFLDVMLGDRPPLTPVQVVYQRMLANNPDDILEHADGLLATSPLLDYYETVMLPALQLAAADHARGLISGSRAADMTQALLQAIDDLADHEDAITPIAIGSARVCCVAGRGPFDGAVSAILAQLVTRSGGRARVIPHADVSRNRVAQVDFAAVDVIILSYLDLSTSTANARYLVRRLRQYCPRARIIVGLWPASEMNGAADCRAQVAADACFSTLRDALLQAGPTASSRVQRGWK